MKNRFSGTTQAWLSYQQGDSVSNTTFGLRRMRIRYYGSVGSKAKTFVQVDLTGNSLAGALLDARIEYYFNDNLNVRMGRFIGAGVRGGGQTFHYDIDIVERPLVARQWGSGTVGADFRDYGFQAEVKNASGLTGRLFVHNGTGSINRTNKAGGTSTVEMTPKAVDGMVFFKPQSVKGLEVGAHGGIGNDDIKEWSTYSAYLYYEPGPYRFKAELVSLTTSPNDVDATLLGYYVFGAYDLTPHVELLGRYEKVDPNTEVDDNALDLITVGAAFREFPGKKNHKLTAALVFPLEETVDVDNTTFQIMWQLLF
ncbi:MAG TPA: hypothetical protein PKV71_01880 [Calditrichia bacterium]|nr:hypothetical protein [Calditrichota bacterium]HQU71477.1 hypothetical protein [Calditrichia bacterium]HQV30592.1 hypothetical protein [Calditrichia bacterium]